MKILLTGEPHSGKSTLLTKLIKRVDNKQGFITAEILKNNRRIGFELISSLSSKVKFADVNSDSLSRVSRYGLDLPAFEEFLDNLFVFKPESLLYVDEIGQMQLHSKKFQKLVSDYLTAKNNFIGTISKVYKHPFIENLKENSETVVINVTPDNRNQLENEIISKYIS